MSTIINASFPNGYPTAERVGNCLHRQSYPPTKEDRYGSCNHRVGTYRSPERDENRVLGNSDLPALQQASCKGLITLAMLLR